MVAERYSYDVFGEPNCVSDVNNPYMFTGRQYDEETGNYYYRARYYNPTLGRFLQPDPLGYYDSMNMYEYCWNNPINWLDPWGLARIRTRPMQGWLGTKLSEWGRGEGVYSEHWQIFYDDGTDVGFFDDDKIRPDNSKLLPDYHHTLLDNLDDDLLHQAEENIRKYWIGSIIS